MPLSVVPEKAAEALGGATDAEIVSRVRAGERALFELLMRRHNPVVYRAIRSIIRDEAEVEDLMQQAYLQAYAHLSQFNGQSRFSTWLTRIAINQALMRARSGQRAPTLATEPEPQEEPDVTSPSPEDLAHGHELGHLLEQAVDHLPELYRTVFMLREVQELDTAEAAEVLGVTEEVVRSRLHRAKGMVREALYAAVGSKAGGAFQFHASRCDRVVAGVLGKLG